jgi:hypothetical protein
MWKQETRSEEVPGVTKVTKVSKVTKVTKVTPNFSSLQTFL